MLEREGGREGGREGERERERGGARWRAYVHVCMCLGECLWLSE